MELFSIYQLIKLDIRYISKTDTALQFYTTKLTDYSVERWRLVMAMVYVFLWTTLECSVELRFKLYSLLSWVLNTNGILCCYIKYSQSIQIFTPTKLIEYFCTVALSLESFVLLCSHTICHCFLLWQKMHFTRAESKADEPGYHLKVFIRYLFGICLKILAKQDV